MIDDPHKHVTFQEDAWMYGSMNDKSEAKSHSTLFAKVLKQDAAT